MEIRALTHKDELWRKTIEYAKNCSWKAGPFLAKQMEENGFSDWERVFVAMDGTVIAGYCTLTKKDCIPEVEYTPYIGFVFTGEQYRGNRLSEKLILHVMQYAKKLGFDKVYLVSNHINLYEKYGFIKIDERKDYQGNDEKIYIHLT